MSTNGKTPVTASTPANDEGSILDRLNQDFVKNFKGKTSKARTKELVNNFTNATAARVKAETALEAAKKAESEAASALIREACGKSKVTIGGVLYSPMSRGDRVFFRKENGDALDLG